MSHNRFSLPILPFSLNSVPLVFTVHTQTIITTSLDFFVLANNLLKWFYCGKLTVAKQTLTTWNMCRFCKKHILKSVLRNCLLPSPSSLSGTGAPVCRSSHTNPNDSSQQELSCIMQTRMEKNVVVQKASQIGMIPSCHEKVPWFIFKGKKFVNWTSSNQMLIEHKITKLGLRTGRL